MKNDLRMFETTENNKFSLNTLSLNRDSTFLDAKNERLQRWFPYLEGFAENFIQNIFNSLDKTPTFMYEPFSGTGTVPIFCKKNEINVAYAEVNPFLQDLTNLKIIVLNQTKEERDNIISVLKEYTNKLPDLINKIEKNKDLEFTYKCTFENSVYFQEDNFNVILKMGNLIIEESEFLVKKILTVASCEALLPSSLLKRNGDIRFKKTPQELAQICNFIERVQRNLWLIIDDLRKVKNYNQSKIEILNFNNAKTYQEKLTNQVDCIITSPPYLNGTNYIRNTKLELWFCSYLKEKKHLADYRKEVITSGINDVTMTLKPIELESLNKLTQNPALKYDTRIPKMINDYFFDMDIVIKNIFCYMKENSLIFFDIGDSIYANVHIPTDLILIELFEKYNFKIIDNITLRNRKSKNGEAVKQSLIIAKK